ncbi:MAG: hypothetical protein ACYSX0_22390, partial [Planctomycetota bacterium]
PTTPAGFVYADTGGAVQTVRKGESYDAGHMFPYLFNSHPWPNPAAPAPNEWFVGAPDSTAPFPGAPSLVGYLGWHMLFGSGSAAGSDGLCIPLTGLPHGCKLIEAKLGYETLGAGMHIAHFIRCWLCRRNPNGVVDLIESNQPAAPASFTQPAAATKNEWTWTFETASSFDIVDHVSPGYTYFALVDHYTPTAVAPNEDVVKIVHLTIQYDIREASGVY